MPLSRTSLTGVLAAQCLIAGLAAAPAVRAGDIPAYFFQQWTVASNCTEQNAGLAAQVQTGLKLQIIPDTAGNGSYRFVATDVGQSHWAADWNGIQLAYRPGTQMTTLPADFECVPGQPASSPFLAMSNYAVSAEPYYAQEHWYGLAKIQGQLEHVLIFPRNSASGPAGVVVLQSVVAAGTVQLDDNGVIHIDK